MTAESFLAAANAELSKHLATRQTTYQVLTTVSIASDSIPKNLRVGDTGIIFLKGTYPSKYKSRFSAIQSQKLPVNSPPNSYTCTIVRVPAKSPHGAMTKALRAIDLQRALWCLMCNPWMDIIGQEWNPINVVRLGSIHTIHAASGKLATEEVWFELKVSKQ